MAQIDIQRCPLKTSPDDRLNAYNRHALAPWIGATGYLTPMYLYRRNQERLPFNMSRWISPNIAAWMLHPPAAVLYLDHIIITNLLMVATKCQYSTQLAEGHRPEIEDWADALPKLPSSETGYFVRLSESSPKDVDDGNLKPVHSVAEALLKLVCSKRAVQALLAIHEAGHHLRTIDDNGLESTDNELYFFPYHAELDRLSEWRCYIHKNELVAISQSRFYQPHHRGVTDDALRELVAQARRLWQEISPELGYKRRSCALDLYAEVHKPSFRVRLIEINPYYPHFGSGSLLFHWLDNADILLPHEEVSVTNSGLVISGYYESNIHPSEGSCRYKPENKTIVRLISAEAGSNKQVGRREAYNIGRADIIQDELKVLRSRGLGWILKPEWHQWDMERPVPDAHPEPYPVTTRKDALERLRRLLEGGKQPEAVENAPKDHPRFRELQQAYLQQQEGQEIVSRHRLESTQPGERVCWLHEFCRA